MELSRELAITSQSMRQFCSIVCETILLRSILRSDSARSYFDSRLTSHFENSWVILNSILGNIYVLTSVSDLFDFSLLKGLCQRNQSSANINRGLPKCQKPPAYKNSRDGLTLRLNGLSIGDSKDTLEIVYEESDEELEGASDDLTKLIKDNNDSQAELIKKIVSERLPTSESDDPLKVLKKDTSKAIILLEQLTEKRDSIKLNNDKIIEADEFIQIYPLAGAFLGSCIGGPVGFLAGVKIGGLAAVGGGILGMLL